MNNNYSWHLYNLAEREGFEFTELSVFISFDPFLCFFMRFPGGILVLFFVLVSFEIMLEHGSKSKA